MTRKSTANIRKRAGSTRPRRAARKSKAKTAKLHRADDGTRGGGSRANGRDAIALLKDDHRLLRSLLDELAETHAEGHRRQLLARVEDEVKMHTKIEEEIFYPAFRDAVASQKERRLYWEALEEHHAADLILADTRKADVGSDVFGGRAKVLKEIIEHHADEEEAEMFPEARRRFTPSRLRELGAQMAEMKKTGGSKKGALASVASMVGLN